MLTRKLAIPCPVCQSAAVFYSCTPACCFNHVCEDCRSTFEPVTAMKDGGRRFSGIVPPEPLPDASDPAVACVKCDSTAVYALEPGGSLVCGACGIELTLELTEIAPG